LLDATTAKKDDPIRHGHRLDLVVRHVDHRDAQRALELAYLQPHLLPQLRIEIGQRLVHQANRCLGDEGAAQATAAAGRPRAAMADDRAAWSPEESATRCRHRSRSAKADATHAQAEHDVFGDAKCGNSA
jgi:hypothetical protein